MFLLFQTFLNGKISIVINNPVVNVVTLKIKNLIIGNRLGLLIKNKMDVFLNHFFKLN